MRVNEIFYSLQGEGRYTGVPAIFVRLCGCNLKCWFCDTKHDEGRELTEEEIVREALSYPARHVVITGGEPTLQINARLTQLLHEAGFYIQMETNGTRALPEGCDIDWITCSPKRTSAKPDAPVAPIQLARIDELKVVFEGKEQQMADFEHIEAKEYRLQPCDVQKADRNQEILQSCIDYILSHPRWKLSLQTHKLINVR